MRVSIITPVFNGANYLGELIESVRTQTFPDIEHIVIDDGSTDEGETRRVLEMSPHVRWWSRENKGQYATMNEGIRACSGDFFLVVGHDDVLCDDRVVQDFVAFTQDHPEPDVVHGTTVFTDSELQPLTVQPYCRYPYRLLPYHLFFFHCSTFCRTAAVLDNNLFLDETMRYVGDWDWITRLYKARLKLQRFDRNVCQYRTHPGQATSLANREKLKGADRQAEREEYCRRHMPSRAIRGLAHALVTFHRRRRVMAGALREDGVHGIANLIRGRAGD